MTHPTLVSSLKKPGGDILASLTPDKADLLHMIMGLSGEVGELLDAIKKAVFYEKPLDMENIVEELGDIEFYLEGLRQNLDIQRQQTLEHNIDKLTLRYGQRYSNAAAIERADKQ